MWKSPIENNKKKQGKLGLCRSFATKKNTGDISFPKKKKCDLRGFKLMRFLTKPFATREKKRKPRKKWTNLKRNVFGHLPQKNVAQPKQIK